MNSLIDVQDQETFNTFILLLSIAIEESGNRVILAPLLIDYAFSGNPADVFALIQEFGLDEDGPRDTNDIDGVEGENAGVTLERAVPCADDDTGPSIELPVATLGRMNDVLTPVSWAVESAEAVGGIFLSSDHLGHIVVLQCLPMSSNVFQREDDCVDSIVIEFLIEGNLPPDGIVCN